jgi:hypothetical protein
MASVADRQDWPKCPWDADMPSALTLLTHTVSNAVTSIRVRLILPRLYMKICPMIGLFNRRQACICALSGTSNFKINIPSHSDRNPGFAQNPPKRTDGNIRRAQ